MKKRIMGAVLYCLGLCLPLCGCGGSGDVLLIGGAESTVPEESGAEVFASSDPEETDIWVYVCGAVKEPGVVRLAPGSRWSDALEAAGGFREDAGRDCVNLAAKLSDGEKLYFPTAQEGREQAEEAEGLVNINTADAAQLCTLPGIGESRAADIIAYRERNGGFESCEDIMKVPGIKESVYGKLRDKITVQ